MPAQRLSCPPPLIVKAQVIEVSATTATLAATINPEGKETVYQFRFGTSDCSVDQLLADPQSQRSDRQRQRTGACNESRRRTRTRHDLPLPGRSRKPRRQSPKAQTTPSPPSASPLKACPTNGPMSRHRRSTRTEATRSAKSAWSKPPTTATASPSTAPSASRAAKAPRPCPPTWQSAAQAKRAGRPRAFCRRA